jgi:chitodextrinase
VSQYQVEHDAHWTTSSAEYTWLAADLQAHPGGVKFAVFHYPLHADNATEGTDSYLDGAQSLEGLLASNGVGIAFNGHAHIYERNLPQVGRLVSYVIGSSGAKPEPVSACQSYDAYAVGWSYTNNRGSACGAAPVPGSPASVFHFALVTVSGTSVTVAPTDENGNTFDVQHYNFATDTQAPSAPANLTATAAGATAVSLGWGASSDNVGVTGYRIYRDVGTSTPTTLLTTVGGTTTSYTDTTASPSTTYTYAVKAFDGSGNVSAGSNNATVTTQASGGALFSDGFESGNLSAWTSSVATSVTTASAFSGTHSAESVSTGSGPAYAYKSLGAGHTDLYLKAEVRIATRGANSVYLLKARKSTSASIVGVYVNSSGKLALRNDAGSATLTSSIVVSTGTWHSIELHLAVGSSGSTQVWYDGTLVSALSQTQNTGTTAAAQLQIGDSTSSGRSFDVLFDDVVAGTSFIAM